MKKFVFIAAVLGFTNVFVAMTQQQNSPISLYNNNNGVETFTTYEVDGVGISLNIFLEVHAIDKVLNFYRGLA